MFQIPSLDAPAPVRSRLAWRRPDLNMRAAAKRKTAALVRPGVKDGMLDFLFRRLTSESPRGAELFESATKFAREPHWYVEGAVPDTLDGRFAVLASVLALVLVRLESDDDEGNLVSVALTERFIEVMESEHRELGLGDPSLGKTVRKLVGSLARRTELWRSATSGNSEWIRTTRESLYRADVSGDALQHSASALERFWLSLSKIDLQALRQGKFE